MEFSSEALEQYEFLTSISFDYGLIDIFTLNERLAFIYDKEPETDNQEIIKNELYSERIQSPAENTQLPSLALITSQKGALKDFWEFTIGDPDPFPSIPHGHLKSKRMIKLDSYLGYTFDTSNGNKLLKRETKKYIASLWNQHKFRDFATKQINWFLYHNPHFNWRVNNPKRIPRRRRRP